MIIPRRPHIHANRRHGLRQRHSPLTDRFSRSSTHGSARFHSHLLAHSPAQERKPSQEELEQAREEGRKEVMALVSHCLNNRLQPVIGNADLIELTLNKAEFGEMDLDQIKQRLSRLQQAAEDIRDKIGLPFEKEADGLDIIPGMEILARKLGIDILSPDYSQKQKQEKS